MDAKKVSPVTPPLDDIVYGLDQLWFELMGLTIRLRRIMWSTMSPAERKAMFAARPARPVKPRNKKKRIAKRMRGRTA